MNQEKPKKSALLIGCVLLLALLAGLWAATSLSFYEKIEVTHPWRGPAIKAVYATGIVESEVTIPLTTRATARIVELLADEGQSVNKDQVLARFESDELKNSLVAAQAKEAFAKNEYERSAQLMNKRAISQQAYDRAKSEWAAAQALSAELSARERYMSVIAPIDGQIIRRDGEVGQVLTNNQTLFWLAASAPLRIAAEIDEENIPLLAVDQKVVIRADAFPDRIFQGRVKSITPKGDPIARSYRVRIAPTEETPLKIGMTAETNIIISENQNSILVPSTAVHEDQVWIVKDSHLEQRKVRLGVKNIEQAEVLQGLSTEDLVIVRQKFELQEGRRISPVLISHGQKQEAKQG